MNKLRYFLPSLLAFGAISSFALGPETLSIIGNIKSLSGTEWTSDPQYCPLEKVADGEFTGVLPAIAENKPDWSDNILFSFKSGDANYSMQYSENMNLRGAFLIVYNSSQNISVPAEKFGYYKIDVKFTSDTEASVTATKTSAPDTGGGDAPDETGGFKSLSIIAADGETHNEFAISNYLKIRPRDGRIHIYDQEAPGAPLHVERISDFSAVSFSQKEGESIAKNSQITTGVANVSADAAIEVSVRGRDIIVSGAMAGQLIHVYNLTGSLVLSATAADDTAGICADALPSGIYIVNTNSITRKIILK